MQIGHKYLFKPTKEQSEKLSDWLGAFANIWNSKINENNYYFSFGSKFIPINQWRASKSNKDPEFAFIDQTYSQFKNKELSPWLSKVPSQILRNASSRWYDTQWKFMRGECGAPVKKRRHNGRSMLLTRELFSAVRSGSKLKITIGTDKFPVGEINIKFKKGVSVIGAPNSITIRKDTKGRWYVSFSVDDKSGQEINLQDMQKTWLSHLQTLPESELRQQVLGIDRGIAIPVATDNANYDFTDTQKKNLTLVEVRRKRWQRKLARQKKDSKHREKTKQKIARSHERQANIRTEFAHLTTHKLVRKTDAKIFILENLETKNMTASASGTINDPGTNVSQKSGLNKAILNVGWHRIATFLTYKALRAGKIVFKISPYKTSQRCSDCGHTDQANRLTQDQFACTKCGHEENADTNAAKSIGNIAVNLILDSGTELSDKGVLRLKSNKGRQSSKTKSRVLVDSSSRQKRSAA